MMYNVKVRKNYIILDTETTGLGSRSLVFNIAWRIMDSEIERDFVIARSFYELLQDKQNFSYSKARGYYLPRLDEGQLELRTWRYVSAVLRQDLMATNSIVVAHNASFDIGKIKHMDRISYVDNPCLPSGFFSLCTCENFRKLNPRQLRKAPDSKHLFSLENIARHYGYLDAEQRQEHTALSDVRLLAKVFCRLLRQKKRLTYSTL